ncbi:hypothetical protein Dimus_019998, partial [Dionaea muscipula]
ERTFCCCMNDKDKRSLLLSDLSCPARWMKDALFTLVSFGKWINSIIDVSGP